MNPEISVVVPLYRTADALAELHRRTSPRSSAASSSLSSWTTRARTARRRAAALAAADERVVSSRCRANVGQHAAALRGLARAEGAWAVVMDGDLQDPPEAIPALVDAGRAGGVPVVFAGRRGRYESRGRLLTARLYKRTLALVAGVPADAGIFMALERSVAERLVAMEGRRRPSLVAMVGCMRVAMTSIPVERAARPSGRSSYGPLGRLRAGFRAIGWALDVAAARRTVNAREKHNETQRRYFATAEKRGMQPTGTPYLNRHVDELVRFAGIEPGQRVLEVGCGMGRYTLLLAERGIRVEGIDLSRRCSTGCRRSTPVASTSRSTPRRARSAGRPTEPSTP